MSNPAVPLLVGLAALVLLKSGSSGEPSKDNESKPKPEPEPKPDGPAPSPGPELKEALPPGEYAAKDGERVVLEVGAESTGPILGMRATRDGVPVGNIHSGLLSGFELEYHYHGVEVEFFQEGEFEISAIPIILNSEEGFVAVNYDASLSDRIVWRFSVEGVIDA